VPTIKPIRKLANKARDLRDSHRVRHSPTGFGFVLADSVEYLDASRWDTLTANNSLFLSRRYLRVLEEAGPENLSQRYAMIFRGRDAVAVVAAQCLTVSAARVRKTPRHEKLASALERVQERMLVCGSLLSWGMHGVAIASGEDRALIWPAVAEALYRLRRADKLSGDTDLVMVKDISDEHVAETSALAKYSYRPLETDPNMVLDISPRWRSFEDYLASLNSKYRKTCRQIEKEVEAAGCRLEELTDVERYADALYELYLQTHRNARLRLVTLRSSFFPTLAAQLGDDIRWTVVKRDEELLGFVNTVRDGETAVGYYIGFDRRSNAEVPIYFRLLQAVVDDAIKFGCTSLSLGRTALEPKARLGARPSPMRVLIRHRIPALNILVRALLHTVSHDEAPERNPFK
jgi:hypothetical protein